MYYITTIYVQALLYLCIGYNSGLGAISKIHIVWINQNTANIVFKVFILPAYGTDTWVKHNGVYIDYTGNEARHFTLVTDTPANIAAAVPPPPVPFVYTTIGNLSFVGKWRLKLLFCQFWD